MTLNKTDTHYILKSHYREIARIVSIFTDNSTFRAQGWETECGHHHSMWTISVIRVENCTQMPISQLKCKVIYQGSVYQCFVHSAYFCIWRKMSRLNKMQTMVAVRTHCPSETKKNIK